MARRSLRRCFLQTTTFLLYRLHGRLESFNLTGPPRLLIGLMLLLLLLSFLRLGFFLFQLFLAPLRHPIRSVEWYSRTRQCGRRLGGGFPVLAAGTTVGRLFTMVLFSSWRRRRRRTRLFILNDILNG